MPRIVGLISIQTTIKTGRLTGGSPVSWVLTFQISALWLSAAKRFEMGKDI